MIINRSKKRKGIDNDPCIVSILGEPASKANSRRLVFIGGKPRFIKSKKALLYSRNFDLQCPVRKNLFEEDLSIAIKIYYKTRRPDLDESLILDLLQGRIFKNDRSIKSKHVEHGLDKEQPRSVIVISSLDNKDLVRKTLLTLVEEEEDAQCR
jgi:Holliday junction resolvase RusA-like endonuclease|tara:strand:+ start:563 stop:1021 length:459 start_codon:yes stop_codon:yes gene_type:complete